MFTWLTRDERRYLCCKSFVSRECMCLCRTSAWISGYWSSRVSMVTKSSNTNSLTCLCHHSGQSMLVQLHLLICSVHGTGRLMFYLCYVYFLFQQETKILQTDCTFSSSNLMIPIVVWEIALWKVCLSRKEPWRSLKDSGNVLFSRLTVCSNHICISHCLCLAWWLYMTLNRDMTLLTLRQRMNDFSPSSKSQLICGIFSWIYDFKKDLK